VGCAHIFSATAAERACLVLVLGTFEIHTISTSLSFALTLPGNHGQGLSGNSGQYRSNGMTIQLEEGVGLLSGHFAARTGPRRAFVEMMKNVDALPNPNSLSRGDKSQKQDRLRKSQRPDTTSF